MSKMIDKSKASSRFDGIVVKQRGLLTRQERNVIALKRAADDAVLAFNNCLAASAKLVERAKLLEEAAVRAKAEFEKAQAELEAK